MTKTIVQAAMTLAMLVLLMGSTPPIFAHGGTHGTNGNERQPPANEQRQTPQSEPSSATTTPVPDTAAEINADGDSASHSTGAPTQTSPFPGLGEMVLAFLVAAPFLMAWGKQRL